MATSTATRSTGWKMNAVSPGRPRGAQVGIFVGLSIATVGAVFSTAPLQVALCGLALALIVLLLWGHDAPPILLLPPVYQWSEVAIVPISTIWKGGSLNDLSDVGGNLEVSAIYGLLGVLSLAVGLRVAKGRSPDVSRRLNKEAYTSSFEKVSRLAFLMIASGYSFSIISAIAGPARELFNTASSVRYVGLYILAYWCLVRRERIPTLAAIIVFELIFGMTGFFAEFKNSLLTILVAALSAAPKVKRGGVALVAASLMLLLATGVFWSAVKTDYRAFVNRGSGEQVVLVPLSDRLNYLADRVATFDGDDVAAGFDRLVSRHGYISYLARTMETVPSLVPHENGRLTLAVIRHITVPRFLFPDKPPLPDDTEVMAHYTGREMVWDRNTSISIGHLAEFYVDFGYVGGLAGMLSIGLALGAAYRKLEAYRGLPALVTAGLCLIPTLPVAYFGTAYPKLVGALVFGTAISFLFQRLVLPAVVSLQAFELTGR